MSDETDSKSVWASLPGIVTALAALITAIGGFWSIYPEPEISNFTAEPNSITIGNSTNLSWIVSNAENVSIRIQGGPVIYHSRELNGLLNVSPIGKTCYVLNAENWLKKGKNAGTICVNVESPADIKAIASDASKSGEPLVEYEGEMVSPGVALLKRQLERYLDLFNDTVFILSNKNNFLLGRGVTEGSLRDTQDELLNGINAIKKALENCNKNGESTCDIPGEAEKPDYEYRIAMPIMLNYTSEINIFTDEDDLRNYISRVWIEEISNERNMLGQDGLNNSQIDYYKSRIEVNKPPQFIYLKHVYTGKYLSSIKRKSSDYIEPLKDKPDGSCKFNVTVLSANKIAMNASNGKYLGRVERENPIDKGHNINSIEPTKEKISSYCEFVVTSLDDGTVTFRADNDKYWRDIRTGSWHVIDASGNGIDDNCKFSIIDSQSNDQAY
jgi:hypothetical protein